MTAYELMVKTNHYLITGGELTGGQMHRIADDFLAAMSTREQTERFYNGVRFHGNTDAEGRQMYPIFFIPPYNDGQKYPTILGQMPKTHILSANAYELEILRLLHLFTLVDSELFPGIEHWANEEIDGMVEITYERLKTTCFVAEKDGIGECFDTSLVVLRFLAAVSNNTDWMYDRIDNYYRHVGEKNRAPQTQWYFWLCLTELPEFIARRELLRYRGEMKFLLENGLPEKNENDRIYNPVKTAILQKALSIIDP